MTWERGYEHKLLRNMFPLTAAAVTDCGHSHHVPESSAQSPEEVLIPRFHTWGNQVSPWFHLSLSLDSSFTPGAAWHQGSPNPSRGRLVHTSRSARSRTLGPRASRIPGFPRPRVPHAWPPTPPSTMPPPPRRSSRAQAQAVAFPPPGAHRLLPALPPAAQAAQHFPFRRLARRSQSKPYLSGG